jgi:hypothetical protein
LTADNYALVPGGDGWEFAFLTQGVWDEWKKDIIRIEEESFSASLCNTEEDLQKVINSPTGLFLAIRLVSSEIAAYLAADLLEEFTDVPGVTSDPYFNQRKTIYIVSVAVDRRWQQEGLGLAIQEESLKWAARKGYERVTAHIAQGAATQMGLGARVLGSFDNWYDTGRTFEYVEYVNLDH